MDSLVRRFQSLLEGHYAIDRELGRGGMATVYVAKDLRHDRTVAIKLLQPELTTAVTAERFLREIQITAKLQHPHILTLIDSGARDGLAYYVMPHVEGESLRERLIWEKQLRIEQAVKIAREVASALHYAHQRGVVHRDIKPENILLSAGHAIVADFGIARAVRDSGQQVITQIGLPLGTPAYMSPEQAAGRDDIDHRSDIYALGCVLFEMLAGRPPFVGTSVSRVIQAHATEPPPSLRACCSGAPEALEALLTRALAKDRAARFQSAQEFMDALSVVEAVETLERATPTGARRVVTPSDVGATEPYGSTPSGVKRLLILAGIAGLIVLAVVAVRGVGGPGEPPAPAPGAIDRSAGVVGYLTAVGVKPLDAFGGDSAGVLSAGLTEEITAQLSRIRQLKVISRTSMEAVRDKKWTTRTIADSLGLRYLLEGSVQQSGRELAVTLDLVDARTDAHVWSDSYRTSLRNILMLRQDIAMKVATALAGQVRGLIVMGPDSSSRNAEAVEERARGLDLSGRASEESLDQAIQAYERALAIDPGYAQAAAELSDVLRLYVNLGFGGKRDPFVTLAQAVRWARRAVELDPNLATGWASRGAARLAIGDRPAAALEDLDRAVGLAPGSGPIRVLRGIVLARLHRYDEALREIEAGAAFDPFNASTRGGGVALTALGARSYDVAAREAGLAATRDPGFPGWRALEAVAYLLSGQPERCAAMTLADPGGPVTAMCLLKVGREAEAATLIDSLTAQAERGATAIYTLGMLGAYHAQKGDARAALDWLHRAFSRSPTALDYRLFDAGLFDPVRQDPAFARGLQAIVARVRARFT
jgi:serine/threonine-protein kinase